MIKENEVSMTQHDHYQHVHNVNKQGRLSHLCLFYYVLM